MIIIPASKPYLMIITKKKKEKKKNLLSSGFCRPCGLQKEKKTCEKRDKFLDFSRKLKKKMWNMQVTVISTVFGALGTVFKGLKKGLEELETIQTTALARILRKVMEIRRDLQSLRLHWKTIIWCEKLEWIIIMIISSTRCTILKMDKKIDVYAQNLILERVCFKKRRREKTRQYWSLQMHHYKISRTTLKRRKKSKQPVTARAT